MCHRASHLHHKIPSAQGLLGPLQRAEELGRGEVRGLGCCLERAFWLPAHTGLIIRQPTHRLPPSSAQWVSSPDPGQSLLDACQHRLLGPTPRVSDVVPKGQGLRICISPSSQGMLLVQRAPSENPLSAGSHPQLHMRITRERFRLFPAPAPSQALLVSREVWGGFFEETPGGCVGQPGVRSPAAPFRATRAHLLPVRGVPVHPQRPGGTGSPGSESQS